MGPHPIYIPPPATVAPLHQVENLVSLPVGMPDTDQTQPKVQLTQDQVDFLVNQAGKMLPSLVKWWPVIVLALSAAGTLGAQINKSINPSATPTEVPVMVKPVVQPQVSTAKSPDDKAKPPVDDKLKAINDRLDHQQSDQKAILDEILRLQKFVGSGANKKTSIPVRERELTLLEILQ